MEDKILNHVLELYFHVNHGFDIKDVKNFLNNPNAPSRQTEFKEELSFAIKNNSIDKVEFEQLTGDDFETQQEVNDFLLNDIWKPLYGNEPIKLQE